MKGHGVILSFVCRFQIIFLTSCVGVYAIMSHALLCIRVPVPLKFQISVFTVGPRIRVLISSYKGESGTNRGNGDDMDTLPCVKQTAGGKALSSARSSALLSMTRQRRGRGRHGREVQGRGGDMCILTAGTHCCTAETNTALLSNNPQFKLIN